LTGGDFAGMQTHLMAQDNSNDPELCRDAVEKKFEEVKAKLKKKEHVLIGHNIFTDLVCLYKTFVGSLPLRVEDFQSLIHGLFPIVFDTKYIVTEGHNSMSTTMRTNLADLVEPYKKVHTPFVPLDENHSSYNSGMAKKHEAGYDSMYSPHYSRSC